MCVCTRSIVCIHRIMYDVSNVGMLGVSFVLHFGGVFLGAVSSGKIVEVSRGVFGLQAVCQASHSVNEKPLT